jgi:hypothetical protein
MQQTLAKNRCNILQQFLALWLKDNRHLNQLRTPLGQFIIEQSTK